MTEDQLFEKLRRIEALYAAPGTGGEREAAAEARERLRRRLREAEAVDPPIEFKFSLPDAWGRRLFIALCRRHGLEPFRYGGQRYSTLQVKAPSAFMDKTLWPEYKALSKILSDHLDEVTSRVIAEVLHEQDDDAVVRGELPRGET